MTDVPFQQRLNARFNTALASRLGALMLSDLENNLKVELMAEDIAAAYAKIGELEDASTAAPNRDGLQDLFDAPEPEPPFVIHR